MVVIIPNQLKNDEFRFIRLKGKVPIDRNWQKTNNFKCDDSKILTYKNNVGVCCGKGNLFVIDIDGNGEETIEKILQKLPPTYVVKTGKQGYHMFYISDELINTTSFDYNDSHIDIKAEGGQVVMEGSIHPETKKKYICYEDLEISNLSKSDFIDFFQLVQKHGITVKEDTSQVDTDKTRSAKEHQQVCSMIARNKTKAEIFDFMSAFDKWKRSPDSYKEYTYNKALNYIESSRNDPVTSQNVKYKVNELLGDEDKETSKSSSLKAEEIMVQYLISKFHFRTILQDEKVEVWGYDEGIYVPVGQSLARQELRNILGKSFNQYIVTKVINKLTADTYISAKEFFKSEDAYLLPVQNGLLDLKTFKLKCFTNKKIFFSKLPVNYNPKSKCPNIEKHLNNVLPSESDVLLMQEAIGNCLLKKYTFQKAVMLVGSGRNGKGITLQLLTHLLGSSNTSAVTLELLENDIYTLSNLHGKLANIGGDLNKTSLKNTGTFKSASGGDLISAPRKFLPPIEFENYAKFFFACNELPLIYDDSRGFWDRWLYFDFPNTFVPREEWDKKTEEEKNHFKLADPLIKQKLLNEEEMEGFLNFAIDGLKRLLNMNCFSTSETFEAVKEKWTNQSDSFKAFSSIFIEQDLQSDINKQDLKVKYHGYCKEKGVRALSDKHIYNIMTQEFAAEIKQIRDYDSNPIRIWMGVKLK